MSETSLQSTYGEWISLLDGAPIDLGLPADQTGNPAGLFAVERFAALTDIHHRASEWGVSVSDVVGACMGHAD